MFNMEGLILIVTCLLQAASAAPQLISFKDGKVGVNFLGYHAEAGLGGGQDGRGLLGGLHASAGTPWGQNAAAGLGGNVNERASGVLYAGAQASPDVGAGAVLGGDTTHGGYSGSEAYANGKVSSHQRTITSRSTQNTYENGEPQYEPETVNAIQKIRPPKKFYASESYSLANTPDYSVNKDVAFNSNKTKNIPAEPAVTTSIVLTKTINKTALTATPFHSDEQYHISSAPTVKAAARQSLVIPANVYNLHNHATNEFKATPSSASSALSTTPSDIFSSASLSHSSHNANGRNIAKGVNNNNDNDNNLTAIIITRDRTKFRNHARKHRRNRHHHQNQQQKRINANRQRQRSQTIVNVVEQKQEEQQLPAAELENNRSEGKLLPTEAQEIPTIYHQQQHPVRRQLIAPPPPAVSHDPPAASSHACDYTQQQCRTVHKEMRSDVVQSALQIPIGILQSLQHSLGNLGSH